MHKHSLYGLRICTRVPCNRPDDTFGHGHVILAYLSLLENVMKSKHSDVASIGPTRNKLWYTNTNNPKLDTQVIIYLSDFDLQE